MMITDAKYVVMNVKITHYKFNLLLRIEIRFKAICNLIMFIR